MTEETAMGRCPYCGGPMDVGPEFPEKLTPREWSVYMAIVEGGEQGIGIDLLIDTTLPGRRRGTLRTCVYNINRVIGPMKLVGKNGRYYLERSYDAARSD